MKLLVTSSTLIFYLLLGLHQCQIGVLALSENENESSQSYDSVKGTGQKILDKFDQVFYGLLDEAVQHLTEDKRGAFQEMVIRHRSDLVQNVKENLVNKDKITLDNVRDAVKRELDNRLELFSYVGSGLWNKLNTWSKKAVDQLQRYCQTSNNVLCDMVHQRKRTSSTAVNNKDEREREEISP